MTRLLKWLGLPAFALVAGCSGGTPNCADSDTLGLLDTIIEGHFLESAYGRELRPMLRYSLRSIRTEHHDEKLDSYRCSATLEFYLNDSTQGRAQKQDIEYEVHSVEDPDTDFEITYSGIKEGILRAAMAKNMGWK